tara:strand:+ start:208 stop:420 length:213 start_codon:yes stop_codon:yes gene_type:complete
MFVTLTGKTNHGKNRVRENGNKWEVIDHASELQPQKLFVRSTLTWDLRWVDPLFDKDFEVEINNESNTSK